MIKFRAENPDNNRTLMGIGLTIEDVQRIIDNEGELIYGEEIGTGAFNDLMLLVAGDIPTLQAMIRERFGDVKYKTESTQ